jgi:hypothetical protein
MEVDKQKLIELAIKHLNVPGLLADVIDQVLEPALDKIVADSANPYDDMAKAALYPVLEKALKDKVGELWAEIQPSE